ncbi:50S ribosomal protein L11 methyltransferase [Allopontixanthobacter sp.]|uniref:50S ribosomal protein L11 methyltransferase n=1 Tax=Allopontixanthobacter sp. TaxID=2906452 RepID=UPI002ABC1993|nr:50S ribosomal protein L11 methyltransferase [Allopontixanthobacter sp.]MDZ4307887.1 50S ribosomal protein L11 methyltransferase [Allopontixanthobacter sp.]
MTWKLTAFAPKKIVQAALLAHDELEEWDAELVISGSEVAEDRPQDWVLEAWFPRRPGKAEKSALAGLFSGKPPVFGVEKLPETDWLTLSQQGMEPIRAGRFHVRTPDHPACTDPGVTDLVIPASQAFGTGQHETTAGCLAMLTHMKRSGVIARNIADIGSGTGLLAFGALDLWPRALALATDIDPVCAPVMAENCAANGVRIGGRAGELTLAIADGMDHPLIAARAPYDLLIANILAGPLVELAPDFAAHVLPGGNLVLAGLLETQEAAVRRAYRKSGFRLAARLVNGDWSILWLRKRPDWSPQ